MMIHRQAIDIGTKIVAPHRVTFGFRSERNTFSLWYNSDDPHDCEYVVLGTGHRFDEKAELVQSVVMPDGFHVFHLLRCVQ